MLIRHRTLVAPRRTRAIAALAAGTLVATACGGGDGGTDGEDEDLADAASTTATTDVLDNPRWQSVVIGPQANDEDPVTGGSLVVALDSEADTYLPSAFEGGRSLFNVVFAIYDPLMARDADGELQPYLAESVEPNDDFTEWTLTLRPNVRFHDGRPLDAAALKRIFDNYLTVDATATEVALRGVERMDIVDERTVTYVMTEPDAEFPTLLELPVGWPFSPDAADERGDAFGDQPVGTGPFRFVSWQRDSEFMVERNPDYWQDGQPYLDRITFRPIPDEATRAAALASGDVDAIHGSGLSEFAADVADIDGVQIALGPGNRGAGVWFNTASPPTDDVRLRQALAHAVDQEAILEVAAGEAAALTEVRSQFFPQDSPFYSQAVADEAPGFDPGRAEELYQQYVNDPERSDGEPVGEPVGVSINTVSDPVGAELAAAYERFYEDVGFDVTVQPLEQSAFVSELLGGNFQVHLTRGVGDNRSPLGEFLFYFGDPEDTPTNFTDFHDQTVAQVIEGLRTAGDLDEQQALTEAMGLHLAEQVPLQWTGSDLALIAADENLRGLRGWTFPDGTLGAGVRPGVTFWGQVWTTGG